MTSSTNGASIKVQARGHVELTADDTNVRSLERNGYFIYESGGSWIPWTSASRFEARARTDGTIERTYAIAGRAVGEAEGRAWLASELPRVARDYAIGADARVKRLLSSGGPIAVLADISKTSSGNAKRTYFTELFAQGQLDPATLAASLRQAGREIESDFELGQVLQAAAARYAIDGVVAPAYAEAATAIESDFELHRALSAALAQGGLGRTSAALLLRAATPGRDGRGIDSDFEQASLLIEVPRATADGVGPVFFESVGSIGSSFERKRVLTSLASRPALPATTVEGIIGSTRQMDSDFERAEVIIALAHGQRLDGGARDAAVSAAQAIGSDHERGRALSALLPSAASAQAR